MTQKYKVAYASKPNAYHWENSTVTWGEILGWMKKPAKRKECGNYILATLETTTKVHSGDDSPCTEVHRDNRSVSRRSAILALDIDKPEADFDLAVETLLDGHAYVMHTTHSSTPSEPRYRLLVQVDRDMAPDEYAAATHALASKLGLEQFDHGSFEPTRFMFKPAARKPEWFSFWEGEGEPWSVDDLLMDFDLDLSDAPMPKPSKNKRDPFSLEGLPGAFNRVYRDLDELIEAYDLPYDKVSDDRYHLRGAKSEAGMGPVAGAEGLFYSHHGLADPAGGQTCSAFDLVRLHLYGDLDENAKPGTPINKLPSTEAMMRRATEDNNVVAEQFMSATSDFDPIEREDLEEDEEVADLSWRGMLRLSNQGRFMDVIGNWDLVMKHDPVFNRLYFNMLTMSPEVNGNLPWRKVTPLTRTFDGIDHAEMRQYVEREYQFRCSKEFLTELVVVKAGKTRVNPIKDYLESLVWDGVERVETCLPGVEDSRYHRLVARKVLTAAVARVYEPGIKWDHTLVLQGGEGLGKTTWIERMGTVGTPERRVYHYTLGPVNSKDTLLAAHMSWIVFSDEGHSLRKADNDTMKEFLTRTHDVFRMPYDRDTVVHPRQFVIWSSTNDETFLRRQEGNRRFLMVRCLKRFDIDAMTPDYVDQLWAEAVAMYKDGERLYLTDDEARLAALERDPFLEEDTNAGVFEHFLNRKVPADWWNKTPEQRTQWIYDRDNGFEPEGDFEINRTCSRQLWHEALGQRLVPRKSDLLEITASLKALGWRSTGSHHFPGYGTQTVFVRPKPTDPEIEDLLS